ncbi:S8 family serine peptidase, partial [Neobacillus drentensis]|uniref:S8 family serine peptidase n=1 Tax=Neobacillus drentensis TaxID=220684 RepID=UPI002FFE3CEA
MNKKTTKGIAILALSTGVLFGSLPNASYSSIVKAQTTDRIEQVLSNLTPAQRQAIKQLKTSDQGGLQLSPEVDQKSDAEISVIVEFKDKPQKTAMLEAEAEGKSLSADQAKAKADAAHDMFQNDLQTIFKNELKEKKNPYTIKQSFKHAFNGVTLTLPANKVKALLKSTSVKTVWSDMQVQVEPPVNEESQEQADSHTMVTFPGIEKLHEEGYTGKGVKVGILDTGIDYNHPDLKDAFKGGYDFVDNDKDPMETTYDDWKNSGKAEKMGGGTYYTEHGTHVAGIIAGQGKNTSTDTPVEGVAPDADIYSYRVLGPYGNGSTSAILAGIDKAVADGMDVINMSLGANYNDPLYVTSIAVNNAVLAGVTMVVSAGNSGDSMYTLGSPGTSPLAITVGASDTSVTIPTFTGTAHASTGDVTVDLKLAAQGPSDKIADFQSQTLKMVNVGFGGEPNYWMGAAGTSTPIDVNGKVVLAQRGSFSIAEINARAKSKGAKAVVLYNTSTDPVGEVFLGDVFGYMPTFLLSYSQGAAITAKLPVSGPLKGTSLDFTFGNMSQIVTEGDKLASFSSRGPSRILYDIKPEVTAPG